MKGFLKFLLLFVVHGIVVVIAGTILAVVVYLLSQIKLGQFLMSIINDGYVSETVVLIANYIGYIVCILIADNMNAYKPFRALCIVKALLSAYSIVSSIVHNESFISYILALLVSVYFLSDGKKHFDKAETST